MKRLRAGLALTLAAIPLSIPAAGGPAAAATPEQEWAEITSLLSGITDAYTAPPAESGVVNAGYTTGLLLGNGDVAVTTDARDRAQSYYLAKSDLWSTSGQLHFGKVTIRSPQDGGATTAAVKDILECSASCVTDGNPETRWVSSTNAGTASPQWATVDLGTAKTINRWVVRHNGYAGRADNFQRLNTKDFALQRSENGTSWTTVDTVSGNTNELTDRSVPAFTARYLRLNITGAVREPADPNQKAYIRDLQLFNGSTNVITPPGGTDTNYRQQQDVLNAEVRGSITMGGQRVNSRTWTADGENLIVTELWTDAGAQQIPIQVDATVPAGTTTTGVAGGNRVWITRATGADGGTGWVAKAAASMTVIGSPGVTATAVSGTNARLAFTLPPNTPVRVVSSVHGNGTYNNTTSINTFSSRANVRTQGLTTAAAVDTVRAAHRDWWKRFWMKSYVNTGDAVLNKFYYGGLYAVAAANRAGFFPGGTYSPWRTFDAPNLGNRYFLNYNTESQYYGVYGANRPELAEPYYRVIQAEIPYSRNSTHAAGYEGLTFRRSVSPYNATRAAPGTTPVAGAKNPDALPSDQQTNGTFAALPFLWKYEYTGDVEWLRTTAYPFLKELGAFWVDFVEKNPATGRYEVKHSGVNEGGDDVNSVYDLGYIRRTLTALIQYSQVLGVDASLRPVWQEVLTNLTPYPVGVRDGLNVILLASQISNPIKGNLLLNKNDQPINLEGVVHPSDNLAIGGDPQQLQLARNTLQWVDPFLPGSRGSSGNGFPKTFTIAARVGWPAEDLIAKFKTVINNLWRANLTVRQFGGGQETSGSIETVNSMLLQNYQGTTRLFPNWPAGRDAKFVRLRTKGAFVLSAEQRGGVVTSVNVTSEKGNRFTMADPWGDSGRLSVMDDRGRRVSHACSRGVISFPTTPGQSYRLSAR